MADGRGEHTDRTRERAFEAVTRGWLRSLGGTAAAATETASDAAVRAVREAGVGRFSRGPRSHRRAGVGTPG